jgi:ATP-dependent DNA helicase RecG
LFLPVNTYLNTPIEFLKGVGPKRAEMLHQEIFARTYGEFLCHFPFRYVDRTETSSIKDIKDPNESVQIKGKLGAFEEVRQRNGKRLIASFHDETGQVKLNWFQGGKWIKERLIPGQTYLVYGKPSIFRNQVTFIHPEVEALNSPTFEQESFLQAVYPTTEKLRAFYLDSKGILKLQKQLVPEAAKNIPECFPEELIKKYKFISRSRAFYNIHLPKTNRDIKEALRRLKFEEFFFIQLRLLLQKVRRLSKIEGHIFSEVGAVFNTFYSDVLPFELTDAQKRVIKEIRADVLHGKQMNRLLQGDVGSGKTIVALLTMLLAKDNGFQSAIMAPTEILAQQHYESIAGYLETLPVKAHLLTGSANAAKRREILADVADGSCDILIGTHAILEDKVKFKNLAMVVIDEQHRFGVKQRAKLWAKNTKPPHILVMTATPIPRTLAMTVYGDLDTSVIDTLPPGRKEIKTVHYYDSQRLRMMGFLKEQIALGRQVYIVYPLIEESANMDYKDLMDGYETILRDFPRPKYQASIVHGKMKAEDKEREMQRFKDGKTQLMVATTVIEVGVDVPNASVMVIESTERFGLSQLHQLRGRVGRGSDQSYCILMSGGALGQEAKKRISTMCATSDGFKIAEVDLEIRGPGEMHGTMQSGKPEMQLAHILNDSPILVEARKTAQEILSDDPFLKKPEHQALRSLLVAENKKKGNFSRIS